MARPRQRSRWGRRLGLLAIVVMVSAGSWLAGLLVFTEALPRAVEAPLKPTDAVAVLTGGTQRIEAGFAVLSAGKARKMLISGVNPGTGKLSLAQAHPQAAPWLLCCTDLGFAAVDTTGNAIEIAGWARANDVKSIRVVTAAFHMPRSLYEIGDRLPGVELVPHPVFPPLVRLDRWWMSPGTAGLIASEYSKYLLVMLRDLAGDVLGRSLDAWLQEA